MTNDCNLRSALKLIVEIKDQCSGGDWDEISEAREIAFKALNRKCVCDRCLAADNYMWLRNCVRVIPDNAPLAAPVVVMMDWSGNIVPDDLDCWGIRDGENLDEVMREFICRVEK